MTAPWGNLGKPGHINRGDEWQTLLDYVGGPPIAVLRQSTGQSIANSSFVALQFQTTDLDSHGGHSDTVLNSRYTAPATGWYQVSGKVAWTSNATGQRAAVWAVNATTVSGTQVSYSAVAAGRQFPCVSTFVRLTVNDYLELHVFQDSGGALSTDATNTFIHSLAAIRWVSL